METVKYTYSSSVTDLTEINSSFDKGIVRVAYHGKNRNGSEISKEAFENSISTIYGIPIVCNYNRDADEIGSHDMEIVKTSRGMELVNLTQPVGFVPSDAKYGWETVQEEDGEEHEYLWVECILWKRQEAYRKIKENGITDESMEITVKDGKTKDGCFAIDSFEFTALCLLESAEPCFESACLMMYAEDSMKEEFTAMIQEFKEAINAIGTGDSDDINKNFEKGGDTAMATENIAETVVDETVDTQVEAALEEAEPVVNEAEPVAEPEENFSEEPEKVNNEEFALMDSQKSEEISKFISCVTYHDEFFGDMCRYSYLDRDDNEVFVLDWADCCYYGFPYSFNGDDVTIDFECGRRKKCAFVDWEEGMSDVTPDVMSERIDMAVKADAVKYEEQLRKYESEVVALSEYKIAKEQAEREEQLSGIFDQFSDLANIAEFEELKEHTDNMSLEAIESKCYELRGRNIKFNFSVAKAEAPTRLPIEGMTDVKVEDTPYGGLFNKYPPRV